MLRNISLLSIAFVAMNTYAAEPSAHVRAEISHLLSYLEQSGCQFFRNGSWYAGSEARSHLQKKYDYLLNKGLVNEAEDFIKYGASQSSMSGKPYQVKCGGVNAVTSEAWLREELYRYRQGKSGK